MQMRHGEESCSHLTGLNFLRGYALIQKIHYFMFCQYPPCGLKFGPKPFFVMLVWPFCCSSCDLVDGLCIFCRASAVT